MGRLRHDGYITQTGMALLVIAFALHTELQLGNPTSPGRTKLPGYSRVSVSSTRKGLRDANQAGTDQATYEARVVPLAPVQEKPLCQFCHCKKVYLDVGTNHGVQIRKLYEPSRFPRAKAHQFFNQYFGEDHADVCAIGFEPNPNFANALHQIQDTYTLMGYNVKLHTHTAVSADDDGVASFHLDAIQDNWTGLGSSLMKRGRTKTKTVVRTVNLVRFIEENISPDATVVMKLDIEGAEFTVFPQLVLSGVLCKYIDFAFIEWHDLNRGFQDTPIWGGLKPGPEPTNPERGWNHNEIERFMSAVIGADPKCNTILSNVDDESFHTMTLEKMPLPKLVE